MTDMMAILKTIPLFQDLAETVLAKLIERIDERSYRVGDYLFREGERGEELFILSQGEVEIARQLGETSIPIARLGEGNFLGEGCFWMKRRTPPFAERLSIARRLF
jgi:CRP/FNR family transcriptional regulator